MIATRPRALFTGRHRQRGAAAVFAAIALVAMLSATAFAVDVGRLYFAQRDLQRLANIAALDAVRVVSGCANSGVPGLQAEVAAEVQTSLDRNRDDSDETEVTAVTEVGRKLLNTQGALRQFESLDPGDPRQDAVRVRLTRPNPARLFPLLTGEQDGLLTAVAIAQQPAEAVFSIGTETLGLNEGLVNSLLAGLLCQLGDVACQSAIIALDIASSTSGLVDVQVTVEQLATAVSLNVQDLSNPTNLDGTVVLGGGAGFFSQLGDTLGGTVSGLLSQLGTVASNDSAIPIRQLLDPALAAVSPETPVINLFDLLIAVGEAANADPTGVRSIELPNVEVTVPSIAGLPGVEVRAFLRVLESPRIGVGKVGEAVANNAQVRLEVRAGVDLGIAGGVLGGLVSTLGGELHDPLNIGIDVAAAQSTARFESLQCPISDVNGGMPIAGLSVENSVADLAVGTFSGAASAGGALTESSAIPLLTLPSIPLLLPSGMTLQLGLEAELGTAQGDNTPEFRGFERRVSADQGIEYLACGTPAASCEPDSEYPNPQTIGTGISIETLEVELLGLSSSSCPPLNLVCQTVQVTLNLLVSAVNTLVSSVLTPLVNFLAELLINPLLAALGVSIDSAQLTMSSVTVSQPSIINQDALESGAAN